MKSEALTRHIEKGVTAAFLLCLLIAVGGLVSCANAGDAAQVKLVVTRDVWVSGYPDEVDTSMGKTPRLKLKTNDEVALLDFDVSGLKGRRVVAAELWMHNTPESVAAEKARLGVPAERPDCLRKIGVSTVTSPWEEGAQAQDYQPDPTGHGATYNQASSGRSDWAYPGSKLYSVIMGNGNSIHCHGEREYRGDGWWRIAVEPRLVSAMVSGLSHGLVVAEESGNAGALASNSFVHSRESGGYAPYLVVKVSDGAAKAPDAPAEVSVETADEFATMAEGAARVRLLVPEGAFGYVVHVNGERVPAWQVPIAAAPGSRQSFVVEYLPAGEDIEVEIRAVGDAGLASSPATAQGMVSAKLATPPALPAARFSAVGGEPPTCGGQLRVWAYPEVTKVDPLTGQALFEPVSDMRKANAVWDGARSLVRLAAAKGEIAAFQLALEAIAGPVSDVSVQMSDLRGNRGVIGGENLRMYRVWYVSAEGAWHEEYAIPLGGSLTVPSSDNGIPGQKVQAVYVDIVVPKAAAPGTYSGTLSVGAAGAEPVSLDVELVVYPVTIPDEIHFNPELNSYNPPGGKAGTPYFYQAHRLAHYHRCTLNTVNHSHTGSVNPDYVPELGGTGADVRVADWSKFDRLMGPLLDGSAFAGNPRGPVPVRTFYLPFHEQWPLPLKGYYAFEEFPKDESVMIRHEFEAPPIEEAFPEAYKQAFRNVVGDFVSHCEEKGWTETEFQCYLNNKYYYWGGLYWIFDEPMVRDDWQGIRFYAQLFKQGKVGAATTRFFFRGDISRPWWQYDQLDGLMDTIYYNSEIFGLPGFARHYNRRIPAPRVYGACNPVEVANHQSAAWCLKAYAMGLSAVLPWNSLGDAESLKQPDQIALIVPGELAGYEGPVASLRVFALRRGAQDVELLRLLALREGYLPDQMGSLVAQKVPLTSQFEQQFVDEAAALTFGKLSAQGFAELKEGVLILLSR